MGRQKQKKPAEIVREIRGERTLKEFGLELGIHMNSVARIEGGNRNISIKMAYKLVEICHGEYNLEDLLRRI